MTQTHDHSNTLSPMRAMVGSVFGYAAVVVYFSVREIYDAVFTTYHEISEYLAITEQTSDDELEEAMNMLPV